MDVQKTIKSASDKYLEYKSYADKLAAHARQYIDPSYELTCDMVPGDGICFTIDGDVRCIPYVIPVTYFFSYVEKHKDIIMTEEDFSLIAI